ncbi:MAG: hypothetical protein Q4Q26_08420 [Eubacteriales bacterium]|nr:hypothetical protein [Eubacteriales bacterium]
MKKRMAILMSMAIAANMIASVPVCAADIFTDSMTTDSAITQEADDNSFSDGSGTPDFADEQENVQAAQDEGTQNAAEPPEVTVEYASGIFGNVCKLKTSPSSRYVEQISGISINGTEWNEVGGAYDLKGTTYIKKDSDGYVGLSPDTLKVGDKIVITSTGYKDLTLKVIGIGNNWAVEIVTSQPEPEQTKDAPTFAGDQVEILYTNYKIIKLTDVNNDSDYISKITKVSVDGKEWDRTDSASALYSRKAYYPDSNNNRIVFDSTVLHTGNVITIKSDGYKELYLKVTAEENDFTVVTTDSDKTNINGASNGVNTLHVRLKGYFESAVTGQKKYDAVSGASTSVSSNKNSNVVVEAADLPDGKEPVEADWKELKETGVKIDTKNTKVNIDSESGMAGMYSTCDSSLSLSGTPAEIGTYPVSVTVTDESGRKVTSNELTFKVYSTKEKLADHLKLGNATPTADGKYMYDMDPWVIPYFNDTDDDTDDIVTVPAEIKAWYGSHISGTYGELGHAVSEGEATTQTLIIPAGCNLTMVNMKVLSSVKIKVENGGTLNLRDSSIYGQIEVENGGTISVNHDDYSGKFLTGTSINGQLILNDGATIKNSMIYSNTNFLPNGTQVRHNTSPVVVTNGNVKVEGKVYIKGDEAGTGTDPATEKSYSGQPALKVSSGTLTIGEGSQLAAYGGGNKATTSVGGAAVILNKGKISGAGTLIAVAGRGDGDNGGNAVEGTGNVETAKAYLEGGSTYSFMNKNAEPGKAYTESVTISPSTKGTAVNGKKITSNSESAPDTYWSDITETPDNKIQNCTISDTTIIQTVNPTPSVNPSPSVNPTVTPVPTVTPIPDTYPEGTKEDKNGNLVTPEGIVISSDGTVTLPDGTKLTPDADGKKPTVNKDETVTDTKGNTYSTDGSITDSDGNYTRPAKAVIKNVSVSKNSVKMVLNKECKGALKYDYVIGTSEDMLKTGQYTKVLKNQEELKSAFAYMDKGTWYVACHAWFKGEDGKKVFGQWSEIHKVDVSATTPQTPVISKVTVKGSAVTVKYTKSKNSQGYDVVLSDTLTKTNGQKRPAVSGENYYVKKIKGNTVTVTFKNVKSGTYYIGLHAWNRTSEDNSKTFSEWSNVRKVKMK